MTTGNDLVCVCGTFVPRRIKFFDFPQQVTMLSMYEENAGEQVVASSFYEENAGGRHSIRFQTVPNKAVESDGKQGLIIPVYPQPLVLLGFCRVQLFQKHATRFAS